MHRQEHTALSTAIQTLAEFAAGLTYDAIPPEVVARAKACITDTIAVCACGATAPWSAPVIRYAQRFGAGGPSSLIGVDGGKATEPLAALVNGTTAHAYEQDSLRFPSAGVHPGAILVPAAVAVAQASGAGGRALITAFVAGCEVMFRIGVASHHSSEALGFHAPGITGPYGAAIAAASVLRADARAMADALGIAASLGGGLLAFSKGASRGGEVKRLHFGRGAEAGVLAAHLALDGYTGPETALDGRFGYLEAYCRDPDPQALTHALGAEWQTLTLCLKRYPCHITAHTPLEALAKIRTAMPFEPEDVEAIVIEAGERTVTRNDIRTPADVPQAQYSVPFCAALSLFRDIQDPRAFDDAVLRDERVLAMCRSVDLVQAAKGTLASNWATRVTVRLRGGRSMTESCSTFTGMPGQPADHAAARTKFLKLARSAGLRSPEALLERLETLETQDRIDL
jgi:2-methylcitrate dehydratase PrpD